jgi:ketosteroid isomerase-like protein
MSQKDVDVVRRSGEHLSNTGELAPECYDPEVEFTLMPAAPLQKTYKGLSGLQQSLASVQEAWASIRWEAREFVDSDDVVVAVWHYTVRSHAGVELELDQGWAYWMRNGKIWRMEQHGSKEEALEAAGLQE